LFKQNLKNRNMKKLFIVLAIATAFASCNDDKTTESTTETTAPATTATVAPADTVVVVPTATDAPTTTATTAH
jgi:uncharacterized lipoprotein YajG